jgi:deoxycytidylate deaminase
MRVPAVLTLFPAWIATGFLLPIVALGSTTTLSYSGKAVSVSHTRLKPCRWAALCLCYNKLSNCHAEGTVLMNSDQFATYLFRGLGRTYLHLQRYDSTPHLAALLQACLYNPVYDRQCEGSRADYLFNLIALTPNPHAFEQRIMHSFARLDDDALDVEQLFDFALLYARSGNTHARQLMYDHFAARAGDGNDYGATQLIDLDGFEGFRFVAARLGAAAQHDPEYWDTDHLVKHLKACVPSITDANISALSATDPRIHQYLEVVAHTMTLQQEASVQCENFTDVSYAQLKTHLAGLKKHIPYVRLRRWGILASSDDIDTAARDLLQQENPLLLAAYLAIFDRRVFPLGVTPLLPLLRHTDKRVVRWTIDALSLLREPILRDVAHSLIQEHQHISEALKLFRHNFQPGDETFFITLLDRGHTDDEMHAYGWSLMDVLSHNNGPHTFELLCRLYECQPCSCCRTKVVQQLVTTLSIPDWMVMECQHDADERTRELAQQYRTHT